MNWNLVLSEMSKVLADTYEKPVKRIPIRHVKVYNKAIVIKSEYYDGYDVYFFEPVDKEEGAPF